MTEIDLVRRSILLSARNLALGATAGSSVTLGAFAAEDQPTVTFSHFASVFPQTLAKANGSMVRAFDHKANIRWVEVASGAQVISGHASGDIDISYLGSSPFVSGCANEVPIKVIYINDVVRKGEGLVARKDAGIRRVSDLRGRKIGVPFNSSAHFALLIALDAAGLHPRDVTLLNMKPDVAYSTWVRGDIDASYVWEPTLSRMKEAAGEMMLYTADLDDRDVLIVNVIAARVDFIQKHPDLVELYLREFERGATAFQSNPDQTTRDVARYFNLPEDQARYYVTSKVFVPPKEQITDRWMGAPASPGGRLAKALELQAQFLKEQGQVNNVPQSLSSFIDPSFAAKLAQS